MDSFGGTITRRMDSVLTGLEEQFCSIYQIDDFEKKINELNNTKNNSDRSSKLRKLFDMFDACGITYER